MMQRKPARKRPAVVITMAFLALASLAACTRLEPRAEPSPPSSLEASRPNIIVILADDLGYGDIGAYGQTITKTPVLDRLAREGMIFTRHYAGSTVCAPSRASLMTGLHTGNVSVRGNTGDGSYRNEEEFGQMPLAASETTIAELLQRAGYDTAMVGKWGLGGPDSPSEPHLRGFDYAYGYLDQKQAHSYYPTHLWENGNRVALRNKAIIPHANFAGTSTLAVNYRDYMGPDYAPDFLTAAAINWLNLRRNDEAFFLYLAYTAPHAALQVPDEELTAYADLPDTPLNDGMYTPHPRPRAARAAMISRMDADIGRVLEALERNGQLDNTLILFTSDNGPGSEGGADLAYFNSAGGLRGEKRDLYEGGIRVPLIAWWPARIRAYSRTGHVSAAWDFFPTLAELAETSASHSIDGISFVPTLLGKPQMRHSFLYWEFVHPELGAQAVVMDDWKLIKHRPAARAVRIELFDLGSDPGETHNVVSSHPEIVEQGLAVMSSRTTSPVPAFNFLD